MIVNRGFCKFFKRRENLKTKKKMKKSSKIVIVCLILLLFAVILFGPMQIQNRILEIIYPRKFDNFVTLYAKEYQVDENLIYALIKAESNFEPSAVSGKDAKGLMQIVDETALDVAKSLEMDISLEELSERLNEVDLNIQLGTKYISMLLEKYGNIPIALTAYNAGIGTVDNWIERDVIKADGSDCENIPYRETNQYVRKILRDYKIYQKLYG